MRDLRVCRPVGGFGFRVGQRRSASYRVLTGADRGVAVIEFCAGQRLTGFLTGQSAFGGFSAAGNDLGGVQ